MFDKRFVRPLAEIKNSFLEVLLSSFELRKTPTGVRLVVEFDDAADAVWNSAGKEHMRERMPGFEEKAWRYQEEIKEFFDDPDNDFYKFNDPEFRFRFVSGGALPVIRLAGRNYYVLIYREIFPVGWNLANGGSDSTQEMLNPFSIVEREMREELIIAHFKKKQRYVFDMYSENPEDMSEHIRARNLWSKKLALNPELKEYTRVPVPIKWIDGPDALEVRFGKESRLLPGCFLNVNASDFGIEVDRIAKIRAEEDAACLDGELLEGELVGSVVGLFEVERMNKEVARGAGAYFPDIFFYDGMKKGGGEKDAGLLEDILRKRFLPHVSAIAEKPEWISEWEKEKHKFALCPVTGGLLRRAAACLVKEPKPEPCDVFLSFAHEDKALADQVYNFLSQKTGKRVFYSPGLNRSSFTDAIDEALDSTRILVAVATKAEHLQKSWPEYEYRAFHVLKLNDRKPDGNLVSYVSGVLPGDLPLPLTYYNAITHDAGAPGNSMKEVLRYLNGSGQ